MKFSRFRPDFHSVILLLSTLILCFVIGEGFMRWWIFGDYAWSYSKMRSVRNIGISGLIQASEHQEILWELKPNLDTVNKFVAFRTTADGIRDREYSKAKPPGVFRIAVIGDSFTMPEGVSIEDAYHSLIEDRLNQEQLGKTFELINFGVAGYSLPQYTATIRYKALQYDPDLILIGFCAANDSKKPNLEAFNQRYQVKAMSNGFFHSYMFELIGDAYKHFYSRLRGRYSGFNADSDYLDWQFRELAALLAEHHLPAVIAYIDNKAASTDYLMVTEAAKRYGFDFIDGTKNFTKDIAPEHIIYLTDKHPNAAADRMIADTLYAELKELLLKRLGALSPHAATQQEPRGFQ